MPVDIDTFLKEKRTQINKALDEHLPSANTRPNLIHEAMRYSVLADSKRIRPIMTLSACIAVGGQENDALLPAIAVEILHTYTLIHDDLPSFDDDDIRRGQPSSHVKYGEANAILAGDALLTLTFEILAQTQNPKLSLELAKYTGSQGVVGGQVEDIIAQEKNWQIAPEDKRWIDEKKTAGLFAAAVRLGAISGGASTAQLEALTTYALHFGFAFQAIDDILDQENPDPQKAQSETQNALTALINCPCETNTLTAIANYSLDRIRATKTHD